MTSQLTMDEELPAEAMSAGRARRLLREALAGEAREEFVEAAELAISEIVTNALLHAGTPMRLRILLAEDSLRVEVSDGSPRLPHPRDFGSSAATGRGLLMLEELVTRWGAHPVPDGKVVWFEISDGILLREVLPEPRALVDVASHVAVELHRMPLLMHQAWQEHAAALLRELMLVRLDAELDALAEHARASDALGVLLDQVPMPDIGMEPEAVMANATEPVVSVERLVLEVPRASLPSFEALDVLLDEALHLADEGELLVPPTQPEIEAMRRWICDQVRSQAAGGGSAEWRTLSPAPPPSRASLPTLHWDRDEVTYSDLALIAADDTNRIVAVSADALALLRYDDPEELVGRRLLTIIPERFHQAHVAGFTLFLVNGRDALLDKPVTVPMVCRDGHEIQQRVMIRSHSLPAGRFVFIAELYD